MQLAADRTVLVLIDVQEKLVAVMHNPEALLKGLQKIVAGANVLGIPIIWNEQNPERMGPTVESLREMIPHTQALAKMSFSCCGNDAFMSALKATERDHVLIAGIETHVCVYQTAAHLIENNYHVQVVTDAVGSRNPFDTHIALQRIAYAATTHQAKLSPLTTSESALFELMQSAEHPRFKEILKIIR